MLKKEQEPSLNKLMSVIIIIKLGLQIRDRKNGSIYIIRNENID